MKLRRVLQNGVILISLSSFLLACQPKNILKEALTCSPDFFKDRQLQTRVFEAIDEQKLLTASAAVLQDLGYTIDETDVRSGVIVCSRDRDVAETADVIFSVVLEILLSGLAGQPASVPYDKTQKVLASLVTTPVDNQRTAVRITFQHIVWDQNGNIRKREQLNEPAIYQEFFSRLSKSIFLVAHEI
jgi:hypothetical protein